MTDVLLLSTVVVAFVLLTGLLRLCDRLVGPDPAEPPGVSAGARPETGDAAADELGSAVQP